MPKYLVQATYTSDGRKGLLKEKASGRKAAVAAALKAANAKLDALYFSLGPDDVVMIVDAPDNVAVASISLYAGATGLVSVRTTPLLTIQDMDAAIAQPSKYRGPGE